jgi:hypothetical protein
MVGPLKSAAWGLALAAIPWVLAPEAFGAAAEQLGVTSLPEGIEVYVRHDGVRGCNPDIDLRIQLDPESTIPIGQVHRLVPRIGAAAAEQCPAAVAARLDVVRGDQPNLVINELTALKVRDWEAEPRWPESPLVKLYTARTGWETHCTNRTSLFDRARREPSTAPGWLRGAWDRTGKWVASSRQWVGDTAAALSSGRWPGEFRARVADFEAAGDGLCVLVRQEIDHAGAALGSGRLADAARYIAHANDLLPRAQAAYNAANAYYSGAVDRAETYWGTVFKASRIAFSASLAVGTAGGSLASSAAGYYIAKYGLFNALEFWADSTEMSLKDAAARRAQILAVELLVDGVIGQLLPHDLSYEHLAAQGQPEKADALLANVSAQLVQEFPEGLDPKMLRQVAEQALVQTTDAGVRSAIERMILKGGEYFLAHALGEGQEIIQGIGSSFGPEYLAKRGTPAAGDANVVSSVPCPERFDLPAFEDGGHEAEATLSPGERCPGFSVGTDGVLSSGLVSAAARGDMAWRFDALTSVLLHPGESHGGVIFGPEGEILVSSTPLFPERVLGLSNLDYFFLRIYEAAEGSRIVELFEVAEDLSINADDPLLATALVSAGGDILYQRIFPTH